MTPHSADPHVRPEPAVVLPRLVATEAAAPSVPASGAAQASADDAPAVSGWSPTAWRISQDRG